MSDENANKDQPATISAPPAATVTLDPQNPLPEASFLWRRILTFLVSIVLLALDFYLAVKIHDLRNSDDLLTFAKWNIVLNGLILTYYFVAPSASELTNMIQTASIFKHSLTVAAKQPQNGPESGQGERFAASPAPESQIPESAPGEAPRPSSVDLGNSAEIDAAPTSRS
jgi:hypothetical protein